MLRKRQRRPRKHRVYRIPTDSYLVVVAVVFALAAALSLLDQPKEVSYALRHEFSVRDPAFVPSAHALSNPSPVKGNRIDLLSNGDEIFPGMLAAIDAAMRTINLESCIFWSGAIGSRFRDALIAAAGRGVEVRVLLDGVGSAGKLSTDDAQAMRRAGCLVEFFHPVRPWMLDALNNRTHRRILVVDGRVGFNGGAGIADVGTGNADSAEHWRDMAVHVEGPVVAELQSAFQETRGETRGEALTGALIPGKHNDVPATKAAGKAALGDLLCSGLKVYEYQPTMLHSKIMIVDGLFATVGSTNFDNRSFRLDEELNLTVYDADFAGGWSRASGKT